MSLALLPLATSAQLYQDSSNSTAIAVRDPARQASTDIDAVIYNPAGTAFLDEGWSFSLNSKCAYQEVNYSAFDMESKVVSRDIMPSVQAAFKKSGWTFSASFANEGGNGNTLETKDPYLTYSTQEGIDVFFPYNIKKTLSDHYIIDENRKLETDAFVSGDLYNYAFRLGVSKQFSKMSAYLGVRLNYVSEKTTHKFYRWIGSGSNRYFPSDYFLDRVKNYSDSEDSQLISIMNELGKKPNNTSIKSPNFKGWGISPVIGIDYRIKNLNFSAKYEFETKVHANDEYESFTIPSVISLGSSWQINKECKIAIGCNLSPVNYRKMYGSKQHTSYEDPELFFIPDSESPKSNLTNELFCINTQKNGLSYDITASFTFLVSTRLTASAGCSFGNRGFMCKSSYPLSLGEKPSWNDCFSTGLSYAISKKATIDLGVNKSHITTKRHFSVLMLKDNERFTASAGIRLNM